MSKRKAVHRGAPARRAPMPAKKAAPVAATAARPDVVVPAVKQAPKAEKVDFATEYHYVLADLRRVGILAAAMFATLIILAVTLP
ncbi:MAG: hypothetical protein ACYC4R_15000 [Anaerolineae bacterium]